MKKQRNTSVLRAFRLNLFVHRNAIKSFNRRKVHGYKQDWSRISFIYFEFARHKVHCTGKTGSDTNKIGKEEGYSANALCSPSQKNPRYFADLRLQPHTLRWKRLPFPSGWQTFMGWRSQQVREKERERERDEQPSTWGTDDFFLWEYPGQGNTY